MKSFRLFLTILIFTAPILLDEAFAERDATTEERAQVVQALSALGCAQVCEVELDGDYFEAEDVICDDGKKYEFYLDQDMNIIKKMLDD